MTVLEGERRRAFLDTASYTYSALEKKYQKVVGPAFEITIGGSTIAGGQGLIPEL